MRKLIPFRRFFSSVFTKLLFISILTWLLMLMSIMITFIVSKHHTEGPFYKNASLYIQYIIADLGSPPDHKRAMQLYESTGLHISYKGEKTSWSTRDSLLDINTIRFRSLKNDSTLQFGRKFGAHFIRKQTADGDLYFEFAGAEDEDEKHKLTHLLLLVLISLVLLICYFSIKRILLPLRWLGQGVHEVHSGNLKYSVPSRGSDELAELASSFNQMTARLKQMLETKEFLLRDISHELRSPLTRIKVALEFIENNDLKEDIEQDINDMEVMIDAILQSAKEHHQAMKQTLEPCSISTVLKKVVDKYANVMPGVTYAADSDEVICMGDSASLQTVFSNCVENGLKFSPGDSNPLQVELRVNTADAVIQITDFGSGIGEEELNYIFEPFYRVDASRSRETGGFGLGLSICKSIIEGHGGKIQAKSRIHEGTQIIIILPLAR